MFLISARDEIHRAQRHLRRMAASSRQPYCQQEAGLLLLGIGWFVSEDVAAFHEVQQTAVHPAAVAGGVVPDAL